MKEALVFVMDQGHIKGFEYHKDELNHKSIDLVMSYNNVDHLKKAAEIMSDREGRFGHVKGENHQRKEQNKMNLMKKFLNLMERVMMEHPHTPCYVAAEKSINKPMLKMAQGKFNQRIMKNIPSDLVYMKPMQIMDRFSL